MLSAPVAPAPSAASRAPTLSAAAVSAPVGALLAHWRKARHLSQLALATEAEISPRHLSFLETGRSRPSREMVLLLASVLDVPLRERNALLLAAGFAPLYAETHLDAPQLAAVRGALDAILRQQEPFPAVVMNPAWDLVTTNRAAARFFGFLLGEGAGANDRPADRPAEARVAQPPNVLRMMLAPGGVRDLVTNWPAVADSLVRRVHRETVGGVVDPRTRALLDEILAYPGVAEAWRRASREAPQLPIIPVSFAKDGRAFRFFSAITTLGTAQDVTAQELRIECFFPADTATTEAAQRLAAELG